MIHATDFQTDTAAAAEAQTAGPFRARDSRGAAPAAQPSETAAPQGEEVTVRWFDRGKGYGFVGFDLGAEALLHASTLDWTGRSGIAPGTRLTVLLAETPKGTKVSEILHVGPAPAPAPVPPALIEEIGQEVDLAALPVEAARVTWYDARRGIGFARAFGAPDRDIFLHACVLRLVGLNPPAKGEALALHVIEGPRGRIAVAAQDWAQVDLRAQDAPAPCAQPGEVS
ncbi:cold-shock protein [Pseudoroseicyclus aestuarii]|uniref:Cold shock CspA family protein n=1 Tax=Pseudoroseicyclus aestuarii TaxID=1795041 RepID=A0A318SYC3_9RHOB|nr:cold shock domain-containing protein [Pseudoroseicyclus aestuarii]PYE80400.1 cold shock CspA family protein [Pseudoroseicyclus aestuarii]